MKISNRLSFDKSIAFTDAIEKVVPGGAHTYSRGRDQFPLQSPNGIRRGQGAWFVDADDNRLLDWSMGLTAVSLGHADPAVNAAVKAAIDDGICFQRPTQIELEAAVKLADFTGTEMVKFGRHGSVVTTAAVKLARAFTGRTKVAVPKDHPFFSFDDWFIGATACDFGIPPELKRFTLNFTYNDIESLHRLFQEHGDDIACVMMEPMKFDEPVDGFLHKVRELCTKKGVVLVFDEMITGLKLGLPGAQRDMSVYGDLSTWGKGIGNGYAIAALAGSEEIMRLGGLEPVGERKLFLMSSTHGGESVGFAAMLATLEQFTSRDIVGQNRATGITLRAALEPVIQRHGLADHLAVIGRPNLLALVVKDSKGQPSDALRTLLMQEMIANGVLFQSLFFPTPSHGELEVAATVAALDAALPVLAAAIRKDQTDEFLAGPAVKPVFRKIL